MKRILVCGAGGFIGNHMVNKLKELGFWVRGVDLKYPEFQEKSNADEFIIGDLRDPKVCDLVVDKSIDLIYQFAADMGGAGFVFSGENDADIMHNSAMINLNILEQCVKKKIKKIMYSSSACSYPSYNQTDPNNPKCSEDSAYPADPDSEYGWEKLFSERLYLAFRRNYGIDARVARYHNIMGPLGTWKDGREKAPAALCRKVALAKDGDSIEVWGDGEQTRSFLYIEDCIEATNLLVNSKDFYGPVNIGSEEMVTINNLAKMIIKISGKNLNIKHIEGPLGVRGRNSDNKLIEEKLNWKPKYNLEQSMKIIYKWVETQCNLRK